MLGAFSMVVLCVDLELPYWLGIAGQAFGPDYSCVAKRTIAAVP